MVEVSMQLASCRLVSGWEGIGEKGMEMGGEVGNADGEMTFVGTLVGGPVGGEDGGPVGCCGLCSCNVVVGCMLGMGNEDVGCPVVDPGGRCDVVVDVSVVCSRL